MRRALPLVLASGVAGCNSGISEDDATKITGVVLDEETSLPLAGARVSTAPITDEDLTGADGRFVLERNVRLNQLYRVTAGVEGHAPETIDVTPRVGRESDLTFRLRLLTVCTPGALRCAQGDREGVEECVGRGERWALTTCGSSEICDPAAPSCVVGRTLTVTSMGGLVLSSPTGISCNPTCSATFPDGTRIVLSAQPFTDSSFLGWTGACADRGVEPSCALDLDADLEVGAEFSQSTQPVSLDLRGDGDGEVRFAGARDGEAVEDACRSDCTLRFDRQTSVTLTATPDPGSEFAGWSRDCSGVGSSCTLTMDDPGGKEVRASFELPRRTLEVSREGEGAGRVSSAPEGIDCGSECSADFLEGTTVTLTAVPEAGSEFAGWSGDCSGSDPGCQVVLDRDRSATARFDGQSFQLSVTTDGDGRGTVTSVPSGIDCGSDCDEAFGVGQQVTLTATPDAGHRFAGWSGDCTGTDTCEVTMDQARTVSATFEEIRLDVTVGITGGGRVVSDPAAIDCPGTCQAAFASGTGVELTATPDAGQAIESWSGVCAGSGRDPSCSFTVTQAETIDVSFTDFFRVPLAADAACRTLFRFDAGARLADACGGGSGTETGTWSGVTSRTSALADAYAPSAEGDAIDLAETLPAPPRATIELTVRRTGASFGAEPYGVLVSDRELADPAGPGVELLATDDGAIELRTWTSSAAFSSVATSTGTLPLSTWAHVAAVIDANRLEIWVDGSRVARSTDPVEWTASSSSAVAGAARDGGVFGQTVRAELDEVRASDVARY